MLQGGAVDDTAPAGPTVAAGALSPPGGDLVSAEQEPEGGGVKNDVAHCCGPLTLDIGQNIPGPHMAAASAIGPHDGEATRSHDLVAVLGDQAFKNGSYRFEAARHGNDRATACMLTDRAHSTQS